MHTDPFASNDHLYTQHGFRKGPIATRIERRKWLEEYIEFISKEKADLLAQIKGAGIAQKESRSWDRDGEYFEDLDRDICDYGLSIDALEYTEEQILKLLGNM